MGICGEITRRSAGSDRYRDIEKWRKSYDIVSPENRLQFSEVAFGQIRSRVDRTVVDAADFQWQGVGRWRYEQIGAQRTKFARESVSNIQRDFQCSSGHRHAQRQRGGGKRFSAWLPGK